MLDIDESPKRPYSAKSFDQMRKLSNQKISAIKSVIRFSPSSLKSQSWHFMVLTNDKSKAHIAKTCPNKLTQNTKHITKASLVIPLNTKNEFSADDITHVVDQEFTNGQFRDGDSKSARKEVA